MAALKFVLIGIIETGKLIQVRRSGAEGQLRMKQITVLKLFQGTGLLQRKRFC